MQMARRKGTRGTGAAPTVFWNQTAMERAFCISVFYRNNDSATVARCKFREHRNLRRPRTSRTEESIDVVQESVRENLTQSIRKHSKALKINVTANFKERLNFSNEMVNGFTLFNNVLFSDEAHFHINDHVNRQNCRYCSSENPRHKHQRPLHSTKVTVWVRLG
ncbi:hypothetical protein EVAR_91681_1 [Eumeta japonica]|uniref:DUF4817 domain-containing protein n=1 Tax=Eumeta variegata TaxID=151549 RepID=A0A4C1Z1U1_EUMVA|nr:hypothetical protein EVAR_91681_1 [Eumeta japonica]